MGKKRQKIIHLPMAHPSSSSAMGEETETALCITRTNDLISPSLTQSDSAETGCQWLGAGIVVGINRLGMAPAQLLNYMSFQNSLKLLWAPAFLAIFVCLSICFKLGVWTGRCT